ncbi:sarcosine oxidase subunit gamma, partial [Mesorhizobium sp. M1C.F.Ca.ET.144.01.1.1]
MAKAAAKTAATASSSAERRPALAGRSTSATGVKVEVLPPAERMSLRAPEASLAALSKALG